MAGGIESGWLIWQKQRLREMKAAWRQSAKAASVALAIKRQTQHRCNAIIAHHGQNENSIYQCINSVKMAMAYQCRNVENNRQWRSKFSIWLAWRDGES
jgi:hypothetical protein